MVLGSKFKLAVLMDRIVQVGSGVNLVTRHAVLRIPMIIVERIEPYFCGTMTVLQNFILEWVHVKMELSRSQCPPPVSIRCLILPKKNQYLSLVSNTICKIF